MNLRVLVLTRIIPVFVLSLLSLGLGGVFLMNDAVSQKQISLVTAIARSFTAQLEQFHDAGRAGGELIARSREFTDYSSVREHQVRASAENLKVNTPGIGDPEKDLSALFYRALESYSHFDQIQLLDHAGDTLLTADRELLRSRQPNPGPATRGKSSPVNTSFDHSGTLPETIRSAITNTKKSFFVEYALQEGEPTMFIIFRRTNPEHWEGEHYYFVFSSKMAVVKNLAARHSEVNGVDFVLFSANNLRLLSTGQNADLVENFAQKYASLPADGDAHAIDFSGESLLYVASSVYGNKLITLALQRPLNDVGSQFFTLALIATVLAVAVCVFLTTFFINRLVAVPIRQLARDVGSTADGDKVYLKKDYAAIEINQLAATVEKVLTAEHEARSQIQNMAYFDALTGLANRRLFATYLARIVASAQRSNESLAVMFIDLDNFKFINDSYGHHFGDRVLVEFAERIKNTVRTSDLVSFLGESDAAQSIARLAGDEFAVLLTSLEDNFSAAVVAERLLENAREPIVFEGQAVHIEASIGIAVFPDDASGPQQLIQHADAAMYHAKVSGKNTYCFFSQDISNKLARQRDIQQALRHALLEDEFELLFQPYVNRTEHRIVGAEILLRWNSKLLGAVLPQEFIPVAESTGIIKEIDAWLLSKALELLDHWKQKGYPDINLSINISAAEMRNLSFPGFVAASLKSYTIEPHRIEFEITETKLVNYDDRSLDIFTRLKETGITLILDDFGKGFTSLNQLKDLPVHRLKIDRDYVAEIAAKSGHLQIVDVILLLSHSYQLSATAEGVEQLHQVEYLEEAGCDYLQGFYFSAPLKLAQLTALLDTRQLVLSNGEQQASMESVRASSSV